MKIHFALLSAVSLGSLIFLACSGSGGESNGAQGGQQPTSGGATGNPASGGTTNASGGTLNGSGGSASGGTQNAGGASANSGGRASQGGASSSGGPGSGGKASSGGSSTGSGGAASTGEKFSFFVTSIGAMRELSGSQDGFGGDLRFGEADGLAGADKICATIAEKAMAGAGSKKWRAFLSTVAGPVNAIDRIGEGPWYDRLGRLVAMTKADLLNDRPKGADPAIIDDLPNENGIPNHTDGAPGCTSNCPDNHDVLTGTGPDGKLHSTTTSSTCNDWTSSVGMASTGAGGGSGMGTGGRSGTGSGGRTGGGTRGNGPWCGHSWPRMGSGVNWMSALAEGGCAPGVNLKDTGGNEPGVYTVGTGGGYGAIYCFALTP